jgi:hypothetical protein
MRFTSEEAKKIGDQIGVDWHKIDIEELRKGLEVELEHGSKYGVHTNVTKDDPIITGRIAHAHLLEFPDYYTRLEVMEKEAEQYWQGKKQ